MNKSKGFQTINSGYIAVPIKGCWAIQVRASASKGFLPLKRLNDNLIAPLRQPLKKLLVGFVDLVLKPVNEWFSGVVKVAMDWISDAVSKRADAVGFKAFE